jgi:hypothetical protein
MLVAAGLISSLGGGHMPGVPYPLELIGSLITVIGVVGLIFGILILVGATMIYSGEPSKVRIGSILVLIFSILSLLTVGGGFLIGFILGLIGGILGLTWKPPAKQETLTPGLQQV